jgi:predicted nucleic acid-binding protein
MAVELPKTIVVDASVGLKWVVNEIGSDQAVALIEGRRLIAPSLFWVETANALAMKARRGELSRSAVNDAWRDLTASPLEIIPMNAEAIAPAMTLAQDLQHTVYDCTYLALAMANNCPIITADKRFVASVATHPYLTDKVLLLS